MNSPQTEAELWQRAQQLTGRSLADIAASLSINVPHDLSVEKGWLGQLMEHALGAGSGSLAQADFAHLGIELKTLPINFKQQPTESTWVCVVNLLPSRALTFEQSLVFEKLKKVLWIPVLDEDSVALGDRLVGSPLMWQPNETEYALLKQDYNEFSERIALGEIERISARHGQALQIRPKAANRTILTDAIGPEGQRIKTLPRGFYLRSQFTQGIISREFL